MFKAVAIYIWLRYRYSQRKNLLLCNSVYAGTAKQQAAMPVMLRVKHNSRYYASER